MKNKRKIGFITTADPMDSRKWSGTHTAIYQSLESRFETVVPLYPQSAIRSESFFIFLRRFVRLFTGRIYNYHYDPIYVRLVSRQIQKVLNKYDLDCLVASLAVPEVAFLRTDVPIIALTDANVNQLMGIYTSHSNMFKRSKWWAIHLEQLTFDKVSYMLYSSEWAASNAISEYDIAPSKVKVIPFGANANQFPSKAEVMAGIENRKPDEVCELLWVGVEWERKGGDMVVALADLLIQRGRKVRLTVVGTDIPLRSNRPYIEHIAFINKNIPDEFALFSRLFLRSSFFVLPSIGECFGLVYAEAAAYGVPSIGYDSGGVPSAIAEGKSGFLLPENAKVEDFAEVIEHSLENYKQYCSLCESSYQYFVDVVNWDSWGDACVELIESAVTKKVK